MTQQEILNLPTIQDINNIQMARIAEHQTAGTYDYDVLMSILSERDNTIARETVQYAGVDGEDGYEIIYGTYLERYNKREAILGRKGVAA